LAQRDRRRLVPGDRAQAGEGLNSLELAALCRTRAAQLRAANDALGARALGNLAKELVVIASREPTGTTRSIECPNCHILIPVPLPERH
jgi:hypothetical protein